LTFNQLVSVRRCASRDGFPVSTLAASMLTRTVDAAEGFLSAGHDHLAHLALMVRLTVVLGFKGIEDPERGGAVREPRPRGEEQTVSRE
jgi:hypothetical protein